jgi:histone deacetylase 6
MTAVLFDPAFVRHRPPYPHPEHPGRAQAIHDRLRARGLWERCREVAARPATREELSAIHTEELIETVEATAHRDFTQLDPDTYTVRDSAQTASLAAGGVAELACRVLDGREENAFAIVRPPGHHAEHDRPMGFCLYNNVAVAAAAARRAGARRVLIVDWDLHHGNGTQGSFWDDPDVLYFSTHQYPFYPGSGAIEEVGGASARGRTINVPWSPGCGDAEFFAAFDRILLPAARAFEPDLVLVSSGFDAAEGDLLGELRVSPAGYARMTRRLQELAGGRLVLALEGGYNLEAISLDAEACVRVLLGEEAPDASEAPLLPAAASALDRVHSIQKAFWPL